MSLCRRELILAAAGAGAVALASPALSSLVNPDRIRAADMGTRRKYLATKFGRICYFEAGTGAPAVFLHGYPLNSFQWRGVIEQLELSGRCIAPDFMGLGLTQVSTDQDLRPLAQAQMIIALLDGLKIDKAHLVANDSGGAVAQLLLAHFPDRVRSVLLTNCDTAIQSPPAAMLPVIELAKRGEYVSQWIEPWYEDRAKARSKEGIGGLCYADPSNPTDDAIEAYFAPLLQSSESRRLVELHAIAQSTNSLAAIEPLLKRNNAPVRILWGADDTIFAPRNAEYLASIFGGSKGVRTVPHARLFWPEEQPRIVAEEAAELWAKS